MGRRGPAPQPTALKILNGNPGKRAINHNEPQPTKKAPKCPSWLSREAKAEWRRVAPELERLGLLTVVDGGALAAYCQAYARWKQCEEVIERDGMVSELVTDTGSTYLQQRPEVSIANKQLQVMKAFCTEFGLTPSSRSRMSLPGEKPTESAFEGFLKQKSG